MQDVTNEVIYRLGDGVDSVTFDFKPTTSDSVVQVSISSTDILGLKKTSPDPTSPKTKRLCDQLVADTMQSLENVHSPHRPRPSGYQKFVIGNGHCFSLPFSSTDPSQLLSCGMHSTEIVNHRSGSNGNYFWNSLRDTIGTNPIIINGMDVRTLLPGKYLNDSIINFWIRWVSIPLSPEDYASKVHVFSSHFLSGVLSNNYSSNMKRWLRKVNIFNKKLLLFPFNAVSHWSLVAVFNPSMIKQTSKRWGEARYTNEVCCMIHLDSLGNSTIHDGKDIGWAIRNVLNSEWQRHYNTTLDRTSRPFTHRCLPLLTPKVVRQDNGFDCGMFVCRYAFNCIQLIKNPLKMIDLHNNLKHYLSEDPLFDFSGKDITRMRVEIHNMLQSITEQYRSLRDTSGDLPATNDVVSTNLFADDESEGILPDSDDDNDDDVAFFNSDNSSDGSGSIWNDGGSDFELAHDEDDEPLFYESTGKICQTCNCFDGRQ